MASSVAHRRNDPAVDTSRRPVQDDTAYRYNTEVSNDDAEECFGPSEPQMVLLCLDYLRDLRRSYVKPNDLQQQHGLKADYLSVAIYALSRALPGYNHTESSTENTLASPNDCRFDFGIANELSAPNALFPREDPRSSENWIAIPNLTKINEELFYPKQPVHNSNATDTDAYPDSWYAYNDTHPSNQDRLYAFDGLACETPSVSLPELLVAGMTSLQVRSRHQAEQEMIASPLFEQFVAAVEKKGFFRDIVDPDSAATKDAAREKSLYDERYEKVVMKFRTKLAAKAWNNLQMTGQTDAQQVAQEKAERFVAQRRLKMERVLPDELKMSSVEDAYPPPTRERTPRANDALAPAMSRMDDDFSVGMSVVTSATRKINAFTNPLSPTHPDDEDEAEHLKQKGNAHMQQKEYALAVDSYTAALKLSPSGPQSHVYFSNRAAAHLSLRQFHDAIVDSERSLALQPTYAKAHARLGLAHFLLGDYRHAVEAYTVSLKYDPDNKSSRTYLEKAARRVAAQETGGGKGRSGASGFSIASEWGKTDIGESVEDAEERKRIVNEREAEKHKLQGNAFMASRDYQGAMQSYSMAIELCPKGENSHVYFSNRAAALCYLEQYEEAEADSLRSLALQPTYGKAHARLGLSRFFMADYEGAIEAYTTALSYDPDNAASKSYLEKAKSRLRQESDGLASQSFRGAGGRQRRKHDLAEA